MTLIYIFYWQKLIYLKYQVKKQLLQEHLSRIYFNLIYFKLENDSFLFLCLNFPCTNMLLIKSINTDRVGMPYIVAQSEDVISHISSGLCIGRYSLIKTFVSETCENKDV